MNGTGNTLRLRALVLALVGLICNLPFLGYVYGSGGSLWRTALLGVSLLCLLYAGVYFLLSAGKTVGRVILTLLVIVNAGCLYFFREYGAMLDQTMIGNVFNTDWREASSFICTKSVLYMLVLGVIPCVIVWWRKRDCGSVRNFALNTGGSLMAGLLLAIPCIFAGDWSGKTGRVCFNLLLPWAYVSNSVHYVADGSKRISNEILLPYATVTQTEEKEVMVLVIGESSRWDHFSLYGYERNTSPFLDAEGEHLRKFKAVSKGTFTILGVHSMLRHYDTDKYYEFLPNYLYRHGVNVIWRANNGGAPKLHIADYRRIPKDGYDEALLDGLGEAIVASDRDKVFVVLHTNTSHGPEYDDRYPAGFARFTPVREDTKGTSRSQEGLINSYDNTIVYTDYLLHRVIGMLRGLEGWRCGMMFVSDHGESLGEKGVYMHGQPDLIAPTEQFMIPFIVWTSDGSVRADESEELTQFHVFHSVMNFFGMRSPIYDDTMNIFNSYTRK